MCIDTNSPRSIQSWRPTGTQTETQQEPSATEGGQVLVLLAANALLLGEFGTHPEGKDF